MPERRLARSWEAQRALMRSQVTELFRLGRIQTTHARAEEVSSLAEKLITVAKDPTLAHRRQVAAFVLDPKVTKELVETIAPRYRDRPGGYTRILKLGPRRGDAAPMVVLELV